MTLLRLVGRMIKERVTEFKMRTCAITLRPMSKEEFCSQGQKDCSSITRGEAFYRFTVCGESERDGGIAGKKNGVPCQNACGNDTLDMVKKLRSEMPFSPPLVPTARLCDRWNAAVSGRARPFALVALGLSHAIAQRLRRATDLGRDRHDRSPLRCVLGAVARHHPHGPVAHLGRELRRF
jgi:hypothetical protein